MIGKQRRPTPTRTARLALAATILIGLVGGGAAPTSARQDDAPPRGDAVSRGDALPAGDVVERVDVVLVNVEVWVTDRGGEPIQGLSADGFELFEDGDRMEITHLAEIRRNAAGEVAGAAGGSSPKGAEPVHPPHLVVYFDQLHVSATSIRRVVSDLRRFLAQGGVPAERVAILRQDQDLAMVADFGSGREELDAAMEGLIREMPAAGGALDARLAISRMQDNWEFARGTRSPCRVMLNLAKGEIHSRVAELRGHFASTLGNLHATARFLAGLPGLKMLVLVSDSFELQPGADLLRFAQNVCPQERELDELSMLGDSADLRRALLDFTRSANTNRVTFYPFQASGLTVSAVFGAENRTLDVLSSRGLDTTLRQVQQGGLQELAQETGGVATFNRNRFLEPLEDVARDMGAYYSLAYAPPRAGKGGSHTIEVRVDLPGARVRHRQGYRDKSREEVRDEKLDGAIAFGVMDNPLGVRLAVGELRRGDEGQLELPLHLLVPSDRLAFLPSADQRQARVDVLVRAREAASGALVEHQEQIELQPPAEASGHSIVTVDLILPEGTYVLGVSVRDVATGEMSVVSTTLAVQDPARGDVPRG